MPTYSVYGIFRIKDHELIYIGSTQQSIYVRWFFHKSWMSKLYLNHYMKANGGYDEYDIELIDTYEARDDMLEFEKQYISDYRPICNMLMNQSFETEQKERDPYYLPPSIRKKIIEEGKYNSLLPQYKWKPADVLKYKKALESQNPT